MHQLTSAGAKKANFSKVNRMRIVSEMQLTELIPADSDLVRVADEHVLDGRVLLLAMLGQRVQIVLLDRADRAQTDAGAAVHVRHVPFQLAPLVERQLTDGAADRRQVQVDQFVRLRHQHVLRLARAEATRVRLDFALGHVRLQLLVAELVAALLAVGGQPPMQRPFVTGQRRFVREADGAEGALDATDLQTEVQVALERLLTGEHRVARTVGTGDHGDRDRHRVPTRSTRSTERFRLLSPLLKMSPRKTIAVAIRPIRKVALQDDSS